MNSRFGFGLLDATALVRAARNWTQVPEKSICEVLPIDFSPVYVSTRASKIFEKILIYYIFS